MKPALAALAMALVAACAQVPTAPAPEARAQLAPTGTLRVAVLTSNPLIGSKNAKSGELGGTTVTLGRELAARAGVPAQMIQYTAIGKLMQDVTAGAWDLAVIAIDPARRGVVDYAPSHMVAEHFMTLLVPAGSSIRSMADTDRAGVRVAAAKGGAPAMILERTLKNAKVLATESDAAAFALVKDGKAEAYAQNRFLLSERAGTLPGSRVLEDSFAGLDLALALPKNRPAALEYVSSFVADAKASGAVQRAIDAAGLRGVRAAP